MFLHRDADWQSLDNSHRDSVHPLAETTDEPPTIISLSDIHGYLDAARSALLTLRELPDVPPVVYEDTDGDLHWADENYVLVFNGDLVDRGPANEAVLELTARLAAEAPRGRVRVTLGNHEAIALSGDYFGFPDWYSSQVSTEQRYALFDRIRDGWITAAYRGYNVTYAHAGSPDEYDVTAVNSSLVDAAGDLRDAAETIDDVTVQQQVLSTYRRVLGVGDGHLKSAGAGLVWLDFDYLSEDAPPQVVGHTRHSAPRRRGNVCCQNVIRANLGSPGGEAVFLETPQELAAVVRRGDGGVERTQLDAVGD